PQEVLRGDRGRRSRSDRAPAPGTRARRPGPDRGGASIGIDGLSHMDDSGRARMVDVGGKPATERRAVAEAVVRMSPETAAAVARGDAPKGDVVSTARIAGIQGAKRTA